MAMLSHLAKCGSLDKFFCFEPSPANQKALIIDLKKYVSGKHVFSGFAISDLGGTVTFHENNLPGTGSLLEVGTLSEKSYGVKTIKSFDCAATTIDQFFCRYIKRARFVD